MPYDIWVSGVTLLMTDPSPDNRRARARGGGGQHLQEGLGDEPAVQPDLQRGLRLCTAPRASAICIGGEACAAVRRRATRAQHRQRLLRPLQLCKRLHKQERHCGRCGACAMRFVIRRAAPAPITFSGVLVSMRCSASAAIGSCMCSTHAAPPAPPRTRQVQALRRLL